jgi:hypothetical protein
MSAVAAAATTNAASVKRAIAMARAVGLKEIPVKVCRCPVAAATTSLV